MSCIVEEMAGNLTKVLKCDNTAAIALASSATGAWRTRHLKVRAAHLRWKLEAGSWDLKYEPGKDLVADIGTKVLAPTRMQNLMRNMEMGWQPKGGDRQEDESEEDLPVLNRLWLENDFKKIAQLVTVITMFQKIHGALAAQNDTKKEPANDDGSEVLYMFGVIMMILGMVLMKILQRCHMCWRRQEENPTMRSMRAATNGTTSSTRSTTRSSGEGSGRLGTVHGRQDHGRHCGRGTSRSSMPSARESDIRSAKQYRSETRGTQGVRDDDHLDRDEPHGEPPNQMDQPVEQHLQVSLTGRRRRFTLEAPWEAWFAESSQCFHRRRECRGLRNANRVKGHPICGRCQHVAQEQGQRSLAEVNYIFEDQLGTHHVDARCAAVTGTMLEIRQCKLCRTNGLS